MRTTSYKSVLGHNSRQSMSTHWWGPRLAPHISWTYTSGGDHGTILHPPNDSQCPHKDIRCFVIYAKRCLWQKSSRNDTISQQLFLKHVSLLCTRERRKEKREKRSETLPQPFNGIITVRYVTEHGIVFTLRNSIIFRCTNTCSLQSRTTSKHARYATTHATLLSS